MWGWLGGPRPFSFTMKQSSMGREPVTEMLTRCLGSTIYLGSRLSDPAMPLRLDVNVPAHPCRSALWGCEVNWRVQLGDPKGRSSCCCCECVHCECNAVFLFVCMVFCSLWNVRHAFWFLFNVCSGTFRSVEVESVLMCFVLLSTYDHVCTL